MEKRKPAKKPCPICAQPLAPQGVALHFQRKHPAEKPPDPPAPASAPATTPSAPPSSSTKPATDTGGGLLTGSGGILT